jgi:hypothetical protein
MIGLRLSWDDLYLEVRFFLRHRKLITGEESYHRHENEHLKQT